MHDHDSRKRINSVQAGLTISWLSLTWTVVAGAVAITIGVVGGSLVLTAFGAIGFVDGIGSAALIVHFRHAVRHQTMSESRERFTALVVASGMAVIGLATAAASVQQLTVTARAVSLPEGILLAAVSSVILTFLALSKRRIARRIPSRALIADSWLSGIGAALALITVAGTGLSAFGLSWADPLAATLLATGAVAVAIALGRAELRA